MNPPIILTAGIAKSDLDYFTALRKKHFPSERNYIDAHLTLFHALPNQSSVINTVKEICESRPVLSLAVKSPVSIGNGVAFRIDSPELVQLHRLLQSRWSAFLSPQDSQGLWPHITIQNKVPAALAKSLLAELVQGFTPFTIKATGLQLWEYLNGPWRMLEEVYFSDGNP